MIYQDRIYGKVKIEEPVILELIKSSSLQRLKGIDQVGYLPLCSKLLGFRYSKVKHDRLEHSMGVFILLKKFGASIKEQIAGLIHDVSHPVFSHCIDYALKEGSEKNQTYQDKIFADFVLNSEIPKILNKFIFRINEILNKNNFPLLEKELPDLCADRIDYCLRNAFIYEEIDLKKINYFLGHFLIRNDSWVFKNFKSAKKFANLYLKMNKLYWSGFPSAVMFKTVGDTIKYALQGGYIKKEDLFTTDEEVIAKIKEKLNKDEVLEMLFGRMQGKIKSENNSKDYDASLFCKSRVVDPFCIIGGEIKKISEIDKNWAKIVKEESKPKQYFIKFK